MLDVLSSVADLVLGRSCAGCEEPGQVLCPACRAELQPRPRLRRAVDLSDIVTGLHLPVACALDYRGPVRHVLYRYKDHRIPELASTLAIPLRAAIELCAGEAGPDVTIMPMPTRPANRRRRGFDPIDRLVRFVARTCDVQATRSILRDRRTDASTKSLGAFARETAVAGAFELTGPIPMGPVILVDDIVTTGATLREACATLIVGGVNVLGAATVAGTP